ncbi:hypothetical protein LTS17_004279 [Exophiala oligosperma]
MTASVVVVVEEQKGQIGEEVRDSIALLPPPSSPSQQQPLWQQRAYKKRKQRDLQIRKWCLETHGRPSPSPCSSSPSNSSRNVKDWPLHSGDLTSRQVEITETLPSVLLGRLASGAWSAEEVLRAFISRTVVAHHLTNPLAEPFFVRGLARARELDEHLRATNEPVGRLHGLPMSLKDALHVKGLPTTVGAVALVDRVLEESDDLVDRLEKAGAVFYCKTNVPQFLMSGECVNYIYGCTSTPFNRSLSAGGSSGGEGSLIALGGSPLGIGTDIAGSIRTPANFNGIYGLCPSVGRFPCHSSKYSHPNLVIDGVAGPLSRSVDGLEVYTRAILDLKPWEWDSTCVEMLWNEEAYVTAANKTCCIGMIQNDGVMTPHPPIQRAMGEVKQALLDAGHEVVEVPFFDGTEKFWELATKLFCATGDQEMRELVRASSEPFIQGLMVGGPEDVLSLPEYLALARRIRQLRQTFLERWQATVTHTSGGKPVDVFILPSGAHVAPPHGTMEYFLYEAISNILDWTCATIPVGKVDPDLDPKVAGPLLKPLSVGDVDNWTKSWSPMYPFSSLVFQSYLRSIPFVLVTPR